MVQLSSPPTLDAETLALYHTTDPNLSHAPILVYHGPIPSTTTPSLASSRIQSHVFTPAGLHSYTRLAVSPSSLLYGAVNCLSREEQGDEVCRALAYSLFKYFSELPENVKEEWITASLSADKPSTALNLFSESHAADLASRMRQVPHTEETIKDVRTALAAQSLSYVDVDLILPNMSIRAVNDAESLEESTTSSRYGPYASLVHLFGEPAFIPTARMRRAPSRATAVNRTMVFAKDQKESLRREMCELVDTEERYVSKLHDIVHGVAAECRRKAKEGQSSGSSSDDKTLAALFPPELDQILSANTAFLDACRHVVEDTEAAAIDDMEHPRTARLDYDIMDTSGASRLADCLLEWLPRFSQCYPRYLQAHSKFGGLLKGLSNQSPPSTFAYPIQDAGEQRLMSMLIEPVQRLPRYSLYLENMIKQLPVKHPALKAFLKAKDIIGDICAQDSSDVSSSLRRLRQLVRSWPSDLQPRSRLITAVDMLEIPAPYNITKPAPGSQSFIGLLFADQVVFVRKPSESALAAHGLLAEIDNPSASHLAPDVGDHHSSALIYNDHVLLDAVSISEMSNGCLVRFQPVGLRYVTKGSAQEQRPSIRVYALAGSYEGRATRFVKDVAKARVEGHFTDDERESTNWEVRDTEGASTGLGLFTSIFEAGLRPAKSGCGSARIKILVDQQDGGSSCNPLGEGATVVVSVTSQGDGFFRLEVSSLLTHNARDTVLSAEFLPVLTRRLSTVLQMHNSMRNPAITCYLLQNNEQILKALKLPSEMRGRSPSKPRAVRPHSPVKALTSMFGSFSQKEAESKSTPLAGLRLTKGSRPTLGPKMMSDSGLGSGFNVSPSKVALVPSVKEPFALDPIEALEHVLTNYVLALEARRGNVIGRVIANRALADEAVVNELYNAVLDQPQNHELAAQSSVDVLFAAFEKFLNHAWREKLGSVIDSSTLDDLQYKSAILAPLDYEEYLLKVLNDLAPQNQRAFKAILKMTIELLSHMASDGDRGALMATITEILVCGGSAHDYMPLLDRFVEEHEVILSNGCRSGQSTPYPGSMTSSSAARSAATGSFSSKASSFGKRLGFGSTSRENSKSTESKNMGDVLRTLSKAGRSGDLQSKVGIFDRTKSVDLSAKSSLVSRPGSRDRPTVVGAFDDHRPTSGRSWDQVEPMQSLKESPVAHRLGSQKKKRRSSLSEIEGLPLPNTSPFWGSPSPRRPERSPLASRSAMLPPDSTPQPISVARSQIQFSSLLHSKSQSPLMNAFDSSSDQITPLSSPTRSNAVRHRPYDRKDNQLPEPSTGPHTGLVSPSATLHRANTQPMHRRSPSQLPVPKGILTERPGSGNTPPPPLGATNSNARAHGSPMKPPIPSPSPSPSKKLRTQTPQKLRNRLQTQQDAIGGAESGLQAELAKIGEELAALNLQSAPSSSSPTKSGSLLTGSGMGPAPVQSQQQTRKSSATLQNLSGRLKALETKIPHLVANLSRHTTMLEEEIAGSLKSAERRAKEMEKRVREVEAENEVLLRRSNDELARVFEVVGRDSSGDAVEELKKKLAESMREGEKWRSEVGKLRRENATLVARCEGS